MLIDFIFILILEMVCGKTILLNRSFDRSKSNIGIIKKIFRPSKFHNTALT